MQKTSFNGANNLAESIMSRGAGEFYSDSFDINILKVIFVCKEHRSELGTSWSRYNYKHYHHSGSKQYCGISSDLFEPKSSCQSKALQNPNTLSRTLSLKLLLNKYVLYQFGTRKLFILVKHIYI